MSSEITEEDRGSDLDRAVDEGRLLHTFLDNTPDHVYFKDVEGRFTHLSRSLSRWLGAGSPQDAIGRSDSEYFADAHASAARSGELEVMRTGEPIVGLEEREVWPDGRVSWVSTTKVPLHGDNGQVVGIFGMSRDITARKLAEEREREQADQLAALAGELARLTVHDELTGLYNRRGFEQLSKEALAAARQAEAEVSVLFTDLDGLKAINDGHGHAAGDTALVAVATALRHAVRSTDVVGRIGGDEFAAVLVGLSAPEVEGVCKRVCDAMEGCGSEHPLSTSIGVATSAPGESKSLEELLTMADHAMYDGRRSRPRSRASAA